METEDEYDSEELHAFNCFLAGLSELGYGWAYRVLDAQHFGVPQHRRRVFVVGRLGDWRHPAAVLFNRDCLSGNPPPGREEKPRVTPSVTPGARRASGARGAEQLTVAFGGNNPRPIDVSTSINAKGGTGRIDFESESHHKSNSLNAEPTVLTPFVPDLAYSCATQDRRVGQGWNANVVGQSSAVRRLTPRECERLMGLPDDWTLVPYRGKPMADGPRYKVIGNSMAVPVVRWIGQRIQMVDSVTDNISPGF